MFYSQDRNQIRNLFRSAWLKHTQGLPAESLEILIAEIIAMHPEYQALLEQEYTDLDQDFSAEQGQTNPFLHMGMHISLREQAATDRPPGISALYKQILIKIGDAHQAEHLMMECLGESLWQAQNSGQLPDETAYIECLRRIFNNL